MTALEKLIEYCDKYEYDDNRELLHDLAVLARAELAGLTISWRTEPIEAGFGQSTGDAPRPYYAPYSTSDTGGKV
jgi:hypothetical protein